MFICFLFIFVGCINEDIGVSKKDVCGKWESRHVIYFNDEEYHSNDLATGDSCYRYLYADLCNMWVFKSDKSYKGYVYEVYENKMYFYELDDTLMKFPKVWKIGMMCDSIMVLKSKVNEYNVIYDFWRLE